MYEQPVRRGRGGLIILTVALLAVLGAGIGLIAANVAGSSKDPGTGQNAGQGGDPTRGRTTGPGDGGSGDGGSGAKPPSGEPTAGRPCPDFIAAKIGSAAALKGYLQTAESEVWVCADADGKLYYQGHRGRPGGTIVDGENGIFLPGAVPDGGGYRVTNQDTTYVVTAQKLTILLPAEIKNEQAVRSEGFDGTAG